MSETGQVNGNAALVQMVARYEALVRDFGLLRQLETLESEYLTANDACTRLAALMPAEGIAEHCSIMLLDPEGSYLELRAVGTRYSTQGFALNGDVWHGKRFALGEGIAGQVAATGVHVRIQDTNCDPNFLRLPESAVKVRSLMCFPLIDGGLTLGVLNLSHGEPGFFDLDRERALLIVARRMARILGRALAQAPPAAAGGLLAVLDGAGNLLRLAGPCEAVTGAPAERWTDASGTWLECIATRDRAGWLAHRAQGPDGPAASLEYGFTGPDGLARRLRETAMPAGSGHRCVLIELVGGGADASRDNPERSASRLLHAQRMHTLGQLASGVVHELGSLLQGISGNLDLALISPTQQETVELISRSRAASLRGAEIVDKVLTFGRASNAEKEPVPVASGTLLEEAAAMLRCVFDPGIVLHVECPPGLWRVCVDPGQLHQALISLGMNARDALEQREGRFPGGIAECRVVIGAENVRYDHQMPGPNGTPLEGDFVRLYVSDNGAGMSPDVQLRAFEPFFTTKAPGRATGLGLSTVYRVVRHHRGWVNLQSTPRRGTTVELFLPALTADSDLGAAERPTCQENGPACVLLVDDEALVRNLGAAILKRLGYHTLTARDGRDALETYQANRGRIGLIILDLQMPDMGGEAVLAQIRALDPQLPIIYSSGMTYYEADDLPPEQRPTALLKKPYLIATMSEIVQQALAGRPDGC